MNLHSLAELDHGPVIKMTIEQLLSPLQQGKSL